LPLRVGVPSSVATLEKHLPRGRGGLGPLGTTAAAPLATLDRVAAMLYRLTG
jgi:hypothetical protein